MEIKDLGKGAKESPPDKRDYKLSFLSSAPAPVDWNKGFRLPKPPQTNQESSDCCVGEGSSKAHWQLKGLEFAVRSVFAYIAQDYGAYLRDGAKRICDAGQQSYTEVPDPAHKTMENMRNKAGLSPEAALNNRELRFFDTIGNSDALAQAVRDWGNTFFGLYVNFRFFQDLNNPQPPGPNEGGEGHCLSVEGYHMHDGQKCIIASSSYCGVQPGHTEHHIKQNYFDSGYVFQQAFVLVKRSSMVTRYIVKKGGKLGILVSVDGDGIFTDTVFWAKSEAQLSELKQMYEIPDNASVIVYPV